MENVPSCQLLVLSILVTFTRFSISSQNQCNNTTVVRAGFWLSNSSRFSSVSNISSSLYTHLYYSSLSIDETSFSVALPSQDHFPILTTFSTSLKANNTSLKTLLSIATDDHQTNSSNAAFSTMVSDPNLRSTFIASSIELASEHSFDGLDLAWRFPSSPSDMANLAALLVEWRAAVNDTAARNSSSSTLLLTATVYFSGHLLDDVDYPISAISENLDWVNALCFGYHTSSELTTAADAPLFNKATHFSTSYGIRSWLDAGLPPCKLVMGIPLYGRSWFLKNKEKNGLGAQVVAAGPKEKLSNQTGTIAYFEIKDILQETTTSFVYDNLTVSSYFHNGGLWVSFDSFEVLNEKIKFSLKNELLGYFLWPVSFDDSNHTMSKQAFDAWQRYNASGEGRLQYGEAPSPEKVNTQDLAPDHLADLSNTTEKNPLIVFHFCIPLFLLLNLVTI